VTLSCSTNVNREGVIFYWVYIKVQVEIKTIQFENMEQERPESRGSSIFSDETVEVERPSSRAPSWDNDLLEPLILMPNDLFLLYLDNDLNVMEWLQNLEVPPPAAVVANMPQPLPAAAVDDEILEPDSSTDWVVPPPIDEFCGPADSTSWSH